MMKNNTRASLGLCLFGLKEPEKGPKVLMHKFSPTREFYFRIMYMVFLFYCFIVISSGLTSIFYLTSHIFFSPTFPPGLFPSFLGIFLLLSLYRVRDYWRDNLELYRMDDNFSGIGYLQKHLDYPEWTKAKCLFDQLSNPTLSAIDKEAIRRDLTRLARETPAIYEAIYELSDERMRYTLVHTSV